MVRKRTRRISIPSTSASWVIYANPESRKDLHLCTTAGCRKAKQAGILSCSPKEAADGLNRILKYLPRLGELKKTVIPKDGERGYFVGLDGRKVIHPGEHYVLAGYLQNGESVIMKSLSSLARRCKMNEHSLLVC